MIYRFIVMASMVNSDTASKPYLTSGKRRHSNGPWIHDLYQNVEAASGRLKQQKLKSDTLRLMMNTAVALRTCEQSDIVEKNRLLKIVFIKLFYCIFNP